MISNRFLIIAGIFAMLAVSSTAYAAPPLSGAIFTTDENGNVVNGNTIYADKCEVYLDGGPGPNAPQKAAGLPDGDYYFQVTDPSGKKLLSTDPVEDRMITVSNGVIVAAFNHNTNTDNDHGPPAIVVQLCPYVDTPNNGGVYKAWVTPVGDGTINGGGFVGDPTEVDNPCGPGCFHGFIPARSKTDNFKVGEKEETFCIDVYKGILDAKTKGVIPGSGWKIDVTDPLGVINTYFTMSDGSLEICGLTAGTYTVEEALSSGGVDYSVIYTEVNGDAITPTESVQIKWTKGQPDTQVVYFINEETCKNCK